VHREPRMPRLFDLLIRRHHRLLELLGELEMPCAAREQEALEDVLERELLAHAAIEQQLVHPALAQRQPDSRALADASGLHAGILTALAELRVLPLEDAQRAERAAALQQLVHLHIVHEECVLFEILGWLVAPGELAALSEEIEALEETAEREPEPERAGPERRLLH